MRRVLIKSVRGDDPVCFALRSVGGTPPVLLAGDSLDTVIVGLPAGPAAVALDAVRPGGRVTLFTRDPEHDLPERLPMPIKRSQGLWSTAGNPQVQDSVESTYSANLQRGDWIAFNGLPLVENLPTISMPFVPPASTHGRVVGTDPVRVHWNCAGTARVLAEGARWYTDRPPIQASRAFGVYGVAAGGLGSLVPGPLYSGLMADRLDDLPGLDPGRLCLPLHLMDRSTLGRGYFDGLPTVSEPFVAGALLCRSWGDDFELK